MPTSSPANREADLKTNFSTESIALGMDGNKGLRLGQWLTRHDLSRQMHPVLEGPYMGEVSCGIGRRGRRANLWHVLSLTGNSDPKPGSNAVRYSSFGDTLFSVERSYVAQQSTAPLTISLVLFMGLPLGSRLDQDELKKRWAAHPAVRRYHPRCHVQELAHLPPLPMPGAKDRLVRWVEWVDLMGAAWHLYLCQYAYTLMELSPKETADYILAGGRMRTTLAEMRKHRATAALPVARQAQGHPTTPPAPEIDVDYDVVDGNLNHPDKLAQLLSLRITRATGRQADERRVRQLAGELISDYGKLSKREQEAPIGSDLASDMDTNDNRLLRKILEGVASLKAGQSAILERLFHLTGIPDEDERRRELQKLKDWIN